jgi:hypothetical protein
VSHALRLSSFPDFDARAPRGAIFVALEIADRVDVAHLAHFLPLRTLTDATRTLYGELKEAMGKEQRETLEELELTVEDHLRRKETAVFFSSRTVAEDSLFLELLSPLNGRDRAILWENPLKGFVAFMLYEISPDRERDKFLSEFVSAGDKAARLKLDPPRRYELMHIEILTEPVPVKKPEPPKKPEPFPIANLFQPQRDFIADTKLLRK